MEPAGFDAKVVRQFSREAQDRLWYGGSPLGCDIRYARMIRRGEKRMTTTRATKRAVKTTRTAFAVGAMLVVGAGVLAPALTPASGAESGTRASTDKISVRMDIECGPYGTFCERVVYGEAEERHSDIYLDRAKSLNPEQGEWKGWIGALRDSSFTERRDPGYNSWRVCVHDEPGSPYRCTPWKNWETRHD